MKAKLLSIVLTCGLSTAFAQTAPKLPMPSGTLPTPKVAATLPTPAPVATPVAESGPRNPMMRPTAVAPAPVVAPPPGKGGLPSPSIGAPTGAAGDDADVDPIKATGKRIGRINGSAIYKLENAYYFDADAANTKK